jgi:hypothetical protein
MPFIFARKSEMHPTLLQSVSSLPQTPLKPSSRGHPAAAPRIVQASIRHQMVFQNVTLSALFCGIVE